MLELAFAAVALAGPAEGPVCLPGAPCPPPPTPPQCAAGGCPPGATSGTTGPPSYELEGPTQISPGQSADFYSLAPSNVALCYRVGGSFVGCATSGIYWFHTLVRHGRDQYFTLRAGGEVIARLVYHDGRLVTRA